MPSSVCPLQSSSRPLHVSGDGTQTPPVVVPGREGGPASVGGGSTAASGSEGCSTPASSIHASIPSASSPVLPQARSHTEDHSKLRAHHAATRREGFGLGWHEVGTATLDRGLGRLNLRAAFFVLSLASLVPFPSSRAEPPAGPRAFAAPSSSVTAPSPPAPPPAAPEASTPGHTETSTPDYVH